MEICQIVSIQQQYVIIAECDVRGKWPPYELDLLWMQHTLAMLDRLAL